MSQILILQIAAHLLADFILQSGKLSEKKNERVISRAHFIHATIVFVSSYVLSFQINFVLISLLITILHLTVDIAKSFILLKIQKKLFFIDQFTHLLTIFLVVKFIVPEPLKTIPFEISTKTLLIMTAYLLCMKPSNIIIKNIFEVYNIETPPIGLPNAGKLIGTTERILALTFIFTGNYGVVGFIIAAKSILRFKEKDTLSSEYVLVGTLLSFGIAVITGVVINQLT